LEENYETVDLASIPPPIKRTMKYVKIATLPEGKALRKKVPDWKTARRNQRRVLTNINRKDSPYDFRVLTRLCREGDDIYLYIWKKSKKDVTNA